MAKIGFVIMRAQPFHAGHMSVLKTAFNHGVEKLYVLLGSANRPKSIKNPWSFEERVEQITADLEFLNFAERKSIKFIPLYDYKYNDHFWIAQVNALISNVTDQYGEPVLFGHDKEGNDYLHWFPNLKCVNVTAEFDINATSLRNRMGRLSTLPEEAQSDWNYFAREKAQFDSYPFPETLTFCCADALVTCGSHIVLIQRARAPGKGNWALPGGFKERDETFLQTAVRELDEEVNIRVPMKVLMGSLRGGKLYDSPTRGAGGIPRITMAYHFDIKPDADGTLPRISPADDAMVAEWVPLDEVIENYKLHDDHKDIISDMLRVNQRPVWPSFL